MEKFLLVNGLKGNTQRIVFWKTVCSNKGIPCVIVTELKDSSNVKWNYQGLSPTQIQLLQRSGDLIKDNMKMLSNKFGSRDSIIIAAALTCNFYEIPTKNAKNLANELYELVNRCVRS